MCGIAGLIGGGADALVRAEAMRDRLVHRGPDAAGTWIDEAAGVVLVHRRLSVQDPSDAGAQPMLSARGRLVLSYNGECFNVAELRRMLEAEGAVFRGHGDTEVILAAFEHWGVEAALGRIAGEFALALWDREAETLTLVRDRVGVKPLYWAETASGLALASESKALIPALDQRPGIDQSALGAYLRLGWVPAPMSIHRGVHQLGAGEMLCWRRGGGTPKITRYWSLEQTLAEIGTKARIDDPAEGRRLIEDALGRAVRERLISDVPLGVFLSGGIDSSLVAALMAEHAERPVDSYAIGSPDRAYDESADAAAVASALGLNHHTLTVDEDDCLDAIPDLAAIWDEPFAESSQIPTLILSRLARKHVTVALSGDGGDELFAGYNRHRWLDRVQGPGSGMGRRAMAMAASAAARLPERVVDRIGGFAGQSGAARRIGKLGAMIGAADVSGAHDAALTKWTGIGPTAPTVPAYAMAGRLGQLAPVERMQAIDLATYLPDAILTKVDRASMAVALEVRVPFVDHRVIEAAFRLAPALKLRRGATKWMLRQMLYDRVPRALVDRPKQGFAIPIERWLRGRLRPWVESLIGETDWQGAFGIDPGPVQAAWARHLAGRGGETDRLWVVLMLAEWQRRQ